MTPSPNENRPSEALRELRDAELVHRAAAGSVEAFDVLVERHQEKIYNAALRFCGNRDNAADVTQRAFLNAFRKIRDFKGDAAFTTWMYRIAFNESVTFRREQARRPAVSLTPGREDAPDHEPAVAANPSRELEADEDRAKVHRALEALDVADREIIVLKDLQDCSYDEIASILGVPKGTVRSRLHRARQELKVRLTRIMGTRSTEEASK